MLVEQLRTEWRAREEAAPCPAIMGFEAKGLVLGGTVLAPVDSPRRLMSLDGREAPVLALLSAAHNRPVALGVLDHIRRAAKCWEAGEDCLAAIHLAFARLPKLDNPRDAARRLFMAEGLMRAGIAPRTILKALDLDTGALDALEKIYDAAEARLPAGNGAASGEWTRGAAALGALAAPAARSLGAFAARFAGPTSVFGLLFVPADNNLKVAGTAPGLPGLGYDWNRDEATLRLTYDGHDGESHVITTVLGQDDIFRDTQGKALARALPGGSLVIDPAAVSTELAARDTPNLCPAPDLDKKGRGGVKGEKDKDYEDYVKRFVNPDNPTPRGWGVQLPNPQDNGKLVFYDDCEHRTGEMIEAKGTGYVALLAKPVPPINNNVIKNWLSQSGRQLQASHGRPLRWYFAEPGAAKKAKDVFDAAKQGREHIEIVVLPWP